MIPGSFQGRLVGAAGWQDDPPSAADLPERLPNLEGSKILWPNWTDREQGYHEAVANAAGSDEFSARTALGLGNKR
jgi:hypothetical protein